jgi:RimJ/RimL family protein N-acetyltransferase
MIRLREYSEADIERLAAIANNKNVSVYLVDTFPYPYRWEDAEKPGKNFAIDLDGLCIGGIGVVVQEGWRRFTAEIGYWLGEEYLCGFWKSVDLS